MLWAVYLIQETPRLSSYDATALSMIEKGNTEHRQVNFCSVVSNT